MIQKKAYCGSHLFSALKEDQKQDLQKTTQKITLKTDEALFDAGDDANHFYLVDSGKVKLFKLSSSGDEKVIDIVTKGYTFAESVMFMSRKKFPVSASALEETTLTRFQNECFKKILEKSPESCFRFMELMSTKLNTLLEEVERISTQESSSRLIAYLLARYKKECKSNGNDFQLGIPKKILASRLSIQPETLSRLLKKLENKKLIGLHDKNIKIMNIEGLECLMERSS